MSKKKSTKYPNLVASRFPSDSASFEPTTACQDTQGLFSSVREIGGVFFCTVARTRQIAKKIAVLARLKSLGPKTEETRCPGADPKFRLGTSGGVRIAMRLSQISVLSGFCSVFCALSTLGKQTIFWAPQIPRPGNRGKRVSEDRNFG